ncbi:hypothetical protein EGO67_04815 [Neisseria gonorrhoeae]|nr:hypothetical protein EGP29_04915 [Neisseria gonorrhoeae]ROU60625.1 hypothetical protein EGO78_05310 [Neisseria gonorrhoeae]ROU95892.1 hypothetical protein EGO67_04815 [Neisseria gonorrhoeae]ROV04396.1 hypothetical protein EGP20_04895 [Neisseria gonorrhoeae]ROV19403.1 hypothetical protein EGP38_04595 [Neisseria gonorrhoeae]
MTVKRFLANRRRCPTGPDSRLRGNDGGAVSVFSDKFLKLKISSFLQKQKTKIRNLKSRHSHESGNPVF